MKERRRVRYGRWFKVLFLLTLAAYLTRVWFRGETFFSFKQPGFWPPKIEGRPEQPFGLVHLMQMMEGALVVSVLAIGCVVSARVAYDLAWMRDQINAKTISPAEFTDAVSRFASAGLGPTAAGGVYWLVFKALRFGTKHFTWLGEPFPPWGESVLGLALTLAVLCLPFVLVYLKARWNFRRTYRFSHRTIRLILLGFLGNSVRAELEGQVTGLGDGKLHLKYMSPSGDHGDAAVEVSEDTIKDFTAGGWPPPPGYRVWVDRREGRTRVVTVRPPA